MMTLPLTLEMDGYQKAGQLISRRKYSCKRLGSALWLFCKCGRTKASEIGRSHELPKQTVNLC